MNRSRSFTITLLLLALSLPAVADDRTSTALTTEAQRMDQLTTSAGQTRVSSRISRDFTAFSGSQANADSLVSGLRQGGSITLTGTGTNGQPVSTTFTPPTRPMGYGNVYISLALAKQQLALQGITQPTPEQLQGALMNPDNGVLQMRSSGMGWGQIANSMGTRLGSVVSSMKSANQSLATTAGSRTSSSATTAAQGAGSSAKDTSTHAASKAGSGTVTAGGTRHAYGAGGKPGQGVITGSGNRASQGIVTGTGSSGHSSATTGTGNSAAPGAGVTTGGGQSAAHAKGGHSGKQ